MSVDPVDLSTLVTVKDYDNLMLWVNDLKLRDADAWADLMKWLSENDLFFMLRYVLDIGKAIHHPTGDPVYHSQYHIDLCKATQYHVEQGKGICASARRSGKSEIRSCALPIWMMVRNPNIAISILSVEKALALRHLQRVKSELERNKLLVYLHDQVLWTDANEQARTQSITWSRADGLIIRGRTSNRANATIEANAFWNAPIGSGYDMIVFDDVERRDKVSSPEAVNDLDNAFSEAISLLTPVALPKPVVIVSNTRFSEIGLVHRKFEEWQALDPKLALEVPAEIIEEKHEWCEKYGWGDEPGPLGGVVTWPHFSGHLIDRYQTMPQRTEYFLQFALSFRSAGEKSLDEHKIHYYAEQPVEKGRDTVVYIGVDPSKGKHDPCAIWVWGATLDQRFAWLDGKIGNFDITQQRFHDELFGLVMKWTNLSQRVAQVRVEDTHNSDWTALVERELRARGCWVPVVKVTVKANVAERKFKTGKHDRIFAHWAPHLNRGDIWFPVPLSKGGRGILCDMNNDGNVKDLVDYMLNTEIRPFPAGRHDDGLDAGGLMFDEKTNQDSPIIWPVSRKSQESGRIGGNYGRRASWMSAG